MLRHPADAWWVAGQWRGRDVHWQGNPKLLLPQAWFRVVGLFRLSQGGMARGWLAEAGGINAQPSWLIEAFSILAAEESRLEARKEGAA